MLLLKYYVKIFFIDSPKLAFELAGNKSWGFLFLVLNFWFFLVSRKTFLRNKPKIFEFNFLGKQFNLSLDSVVDIAVLIEVFVYKEYDWKLEHKVSNVLDLGAHWGDSSIYYAIKYPKALVYAVEPTPDAFAKLEDLTSQFANIVPINGALASEVGKQKMFMSNTTFGNSFVDRGGVYNEIVVPTYDFASLCKNAKVEMFDLVKFDIEGAEKYIFADSRIRSYSLAFIGEIHLDLMEYTLDEIKDYFKDFKLDLVKLNESRYILKAVK